MKKYSNIALNNQYLIYNSIKNNVCLFCQGNCKLSILTYSIMGMCNTYLFGFSISYKIWPKANIEFRFSYSKEEISPRTIIRYSYNKNESFIENSDVLKMNRIDFIADLSNNNQTINMINLLEFYS